ncbi:MAG TPA: M1 family aminopeptidase, partial [Cyclobacteriaceae bacterium]|nr:M1 family aminopeptidase [Cyclobacteriaceae bacterium]
HDLLHTKLELSLDWEHQWVNGIATLTLKPYFYPQDQLILDAKNFEVHSIRLLNEFDEKDLKFFNDDSRIYITLDTVYSRHNEYHIKIEYTARPRSRPDFKGKAIGSDKGFYFIDPGNTDPDVPRQVWTQGETDYNSAWFPTIDQPNERMTGEIYLTLDKEFVSLSNGVLVYSRTNDDGTRTDYWKMDQPLPPYLFMVAAGDFVIIKDQWKQVPLYYYVEPDYAPFARGIFGRTGEMMTYFSEITGMDYPWPKYAQIIVREFVTGAMENTTATVYYEDLLKDNHELVDGNDDNIIAHELFHHWFGDLVTCESWANLALNEAFANYSEYLWKEYKHGPDEADLHAMGERSQYFDEARTKRENLIRYYYDDPNDMFDSHSYAKGGLILHMLRKYTGDEAFFTALNRYLEKYKFSSAEVHDLRMVFEEVTGEDLNWFFDEWFLASGHPVLKIDENYVEGKAQITVTQLQDLNTTPLYRLPVAVDIWSSGAKETYHIVVDKLKQTFEFNVSSKPEFILFDSEQQLLAEVQHSRDIGQFIFQFYHTDHFQTRYESLDTLSQLTQDSTARKVVIDALNVPFWYFRQMAVNAFEDYNGPDLAEIREKINQLAVQDPVSAVRADAISTLFSIGKEHFNETYKRALADTSYSVIGSALYACMQSTPEAIPGLIKQFQGFNNLYVTIPLASYFIDQKDFSRYEWFVEKISGMKWEGLWYMLQYFGEFLMNCPNLDQRRGIVVLEQYARQHKSIYVRFAAYQGLGLLADLSGVEELLKDIAKNEKDETLKSLYQSMQ